MSTPDAATRAGAIAVDYPESDGQPMAETELHLDEMVDLLFRLRDRYAADPQAYVASNMFVYFQEGDASAVVAPDVYVVFGVPKVRRRTFKIWEEGAAPAVVFEVTSRKTRSPDRRKRALYARLGVAEYVLYDPEGEYLRPPLQGYRLRRDALEPIEPDGSGAIRLERLGLDIRLEGDGLIELYDARSGERLLRPGERAAALEAERQRVEVERRRAAEARKRAHAERKRAEAEAERAAALEDEVARLREALRHAGGSA